MSENQQQQLIPYEQFSTLPELVTKQKQALAKAVIAVEKLPAVTDENSKANAFALRDKIRLAHDTYKELRMPLTRLLNQVISEFTTTEADFRALIDNIDRKTNAYAKKQLEEQRTQEAQAAEKLKAEQHKIEQNSQAKIYAQRRLDEILRKLREHCGTIVGQVSDENLEESKKRLSKEPAWTDKFEQFFLAPPKNGELAGVPVEVYQTVATEMLEETKLTYVKKAKEIMSDCLGLLPVALKNKEDAKKLQEIEATRAEEAAKLAEETMIAKAEGEKAIATLDSQSSVPPEPKVKTKHTIEVVQNSGWLQIIAFWYEHDPKAKSDDVSKKTFLQCKTFAEKKYNNDGVKIEHAGVKYVEDVKAKK